MERRSKMKRKWMTVRASDRPVDVVDPETGEVLCRATPVIRISAIKEEPFVKLFLESLGKDFNLTKAQRKVLFWLVEHMDKENLVYIDLRELAGIVGLSYGTVRNTICLLRKVNLVRKEKPHIYRINPHFAAKVTAEDRVAIVKIWD